MLQINGLIYSINLQENRVLHRRDERRLTEAKASNLYDSNKPVNYL